MKVIKLLSFLLAIVLLDACRSDEFTEEPGTNLIPMDLPVSITGNLTGLVVDENQEALSDATVELDGSITTTDENGVFILWMYLDFSKVTSPAPQSVIRIDHRPTFASIITFIDAPVLFGIDGRIHAL